MNEEERQAKIKDARQRESQLLRHLDVVRSEIKKLVHAYEPVERVAIYLWVMRVEEEEDSAELVAEMKRDPAFRDAKWLSLNIEEERDRFRDLAVRMLQSVKDMSS